MSAITTHILDVSRGRPASGVEVTLEIAEEEEPQRSWRVVGSGRTDDDGRAGTLVPDATEMLAGLYRLVFEVDEYFADRGVESFYPRVVVEFDVRDEHQHYHVPLLLSPFGYSTYRGS